MPPTTLPNTCKTNSVTHVVCLKEKRTLHRVFAVQAGFWRESDEELAAV
jgi:hypothetical protein